MTENDVRSNVGYWVVKLTHSAHHELCRSMTQSGGPAAQAGVWPRPYNRPPKLMTPCRSNLAAEGAKIPQCSTVLPRPDSAILRNETRVHRRHGGFDDDRHA